MRVLYLLSTLLFSLNCSAINYSKGAANYTFVYRVQPVDYQTLNLSIQVEIPPNHLPKKSFYIIQPSVFGYAFKSFAFQDVKAKGNAQSLITEIGGTLLYKDSIDYNETYKPERITCWLTVERLFKKGKSQIITFELPFNEPLKFYLDQSKQTYILLTASYQIV